MEQGSNGLKAQSGVPTLCIECSHKNIYHFYVKHSEQVKPKTVSVSYITVVANWTFVVLDLCTRMFNVLKTNTVGSSLGNKTTFSGSKST